MNELISNDPISEHLLLTMAKTYPVFDGDLAPKECRYDLFQGAWLLEGLGSLFRGVTKQASAKDKEVRH